MNEQARALLLVGALLSGVSGSTGFVGGRMTAPVPPAEVRFVQVPVPAAVVMPAEAASVEPDVSAPKVEPDDAVVSAPPPVEVKPPPAKVDAKPKAKIEPTIKPTVKPQAKPEVRPRTPAPKKSLPSCAVVQRENARMTWSQKMAAYHSATAEQIAYGKRCLGL